MASRDYRYYCLDASGRLHEAEWFQAEDDEAAVSQIRNKHPDAKCEIWQGTRLVASIAPQHPDADHHSAIGLI